MSAIFDVVKRGIVSSDLERSEITKVSQLHGPAGVVRRSTIADANQRVKSIFRFKRARHILTMISLVALFWGMPQSSLAESLDVREEFENNEFDREQWKMDKVAPEVGTVEVTDGALHVVIPPGPAARPQFHFGSKFRIKGDFEATVDYRISSLPNPTKEFVNLEIIASGPQGMAHLARSNLHDAGEGFVVFHLPFEPSKEKQTWKFTKGDAKKGRLRIRREGETVLYSQSTDENEGFQHLAEVKYGSGPIDKIQVGFSVMGETTKPYDIQIDNIEITSSNETFVAAVKKTSTALFHPLSLIGIAVLLAGLATIGFLIWRLR